MRTQLPLAFSVFFSACIGDVSGLIPKPEPVPVSGPAQDAGPETLGCQTACGVHARCEVASSGAHCVCEPGFHLGSSGCNPDVAPCSVVTCSGHGRCVETAGALSCTCDPGYTAVGTACTANPTNPCEGVSCGGNGSCAVVAGVPQCACSSGFHPVGADCVRDAGDPCAGVTCGGHGACGVSGAVASCQCAPGYHTTGLDCAVDVSSDPCAGVQCSGHGTCAAPGGLAACTCESGYRVSGLNCLSNSAPDPCVGQTCGGHGHCLADRGRAECHCDAGFIQASGALSCQPVGTTACVGVSCGAGGTCALQASAFGVEAICSCDPGFVSYGRACVREELLFCRDALDMTVPRGTARCSANSTTVESCYDTNADGTLEWGPANLSCPSGTCDASCLAQDCSIAGCPNGGACMGSLDGMHVGLCVPACNCANCGNCGAGGSFSNFQAFCGNRSGEPATIACSMPCPGVRDGCIPLPLSGGGFCFTDQGCFSAPPR